MTLFALGFKSYVSWPLPAFPTSSDVTLLLVQLQPRWPFFLFLYTCHLTFCIRVFAFTVPCSRICSCFLWIVFSVPFRFQGASFIYHPICPVHLITLGSSHSSSLQQYLALLLFLLFFVSSSTQKVISMRVGTLSAVFHCYIPNTYNKYLLKHFGLH